MYKILSIDGGGIRGVIPAAVLQEFETKTGRKISEMFDLVVGTSTGGIIAAGLSVPDTNGSAKYSAGDMLELYSNFGREIFNKSLWKGITSLGGLVDEQYEEDRLEELLFEYFGNTTLADCLIPIILTTYDIEQRKPYFFKTRHAKSLEDRNHYLRDATRATSAAPTYFEPEVVTSHATAPTRRVLVDGGVFVNNPALVAYSEAIASGIAPNDIMLVSIGTGLTNRKIPFEEAKDWGAAGWVRPIIGIMMDGTSDATDFHLQQLLPGKQNTEHQRFFRLNTELNLALDDLDAAHNSNIKALKQEAQDILETQAEEIALILNLLT